MCSDIRTAWVMVGFFLGAVLVAGCGSEPQNPEGSGIAGTSAQGAAGAGATGGATGTAGGSAGASAFGGGAGAGASNSAGTGGAATGGVMGEAGNAGVGGNAGGGSGGGGSGAGGSGGAPPAADSICPPGPFADSPLPANPTAAPVQSGLRFTEGPVWIMSEMALFFSDLLLSSPFPSQIYKFVPETNRLEVFIEDSGSNGMAMTLDGQLLACTHDIQGVFVYELATKDRSPLISDYMGQSFSSPNDIAVRSDGNIYFSDPSWQRAGRPQQLPNAVYRRSPEGALNVVETIDLPNGVTLSPDENTLYVSNIGSNQGNSVRAYDVATDGSTSNGRTFINTGSDGMGMDCAGNLYLTGQGDVQVYDPEGQLIGTIGAHATTNVAFGGPERKTLYITGSGAVYAIELNIPGYPY